MGELKNRKIRLSCHLNDAKGTTIAGPGAVLKVGHDLDETIARQLLAGGSASLLSDRSPESGDEKEG